MKLEYVDCQIEGTLKAPQCQAIQHVCDALTCQLYNRSYAAAKEAQGQVDQIAAEAIAELDEQTRRDIIEHVRFVPILD